MDGPVPDQPDQVGQEAFAVIRDAMLPAIMKLAYRKGNPQAWILDYRV